MWRCKGPCRNMVPYFGFVWLKKGDRSPKKGDLMCVNSDECHHDFEKYGKRSGSMTEWDCITMFNGEFIQVNGIQIHTHEMLSIENHHFKIAPSSYQPDVQAIQGAWNPPAIPNHLYMNFDDDTKTFTKLAYAYAELYETEDEDTSRTVCMICCESIYEVLEMIIEHLEDCTGLTYSIINNRESLPILKVEKE